MRLRFLKNEHGQNLAILAGGIVLLFAILLVALDMGNLSLERRQMQNAADSGALAGAQALCLGTPEAAARALAATVAVQNGAEWATPEAPDQWTIQVTAGEDAPLFLGGFIGQDTSPVGALAESRCGSPIEGCSTWPVTLEVGKFQAMGCGEEFFITIENEDDSDCADIYDCSNVFFGSSNPQRGWWSSPANGCGTTELWFGIFNGYPDYPVHIGQCISGNGGEHTGALSGGPNNCTQTSVDRWLTCPRSHTVTIPLFSSTGCTPSAHASTCNDTYLVGGFGCFDVTQVYSGGNRWTVPFQDENNPLNPRPGQRMRLRGILARVNCNCTMVCSNSGWVTPPPNSVRVPYLSE